MSPILIPVLILSGISLVMAALLAVGRKAFYVEVDERREKLMEILPGANCGGCGFPGCSGYASALVAGKTAPNLCPPGGVDLASEIGKLLGVEAGEVVKKIALVACAGDSTLALNRARYFGIEECASAHVAAGGPKKCVYGCLGFGSCQRACAFNAIEISDNGLAYVIEEKCTGCGQCIAACPRKIIRMVEAKETVHVLCVNPEKAEAVKEACQVGCTGCKLCTKRSSRFVMKESLARVDYTATENIPEDIRFVCPQGSIFDRRATSLFAWVSTPSVREEYKRNRALWKEADRAGVKKASAEAASEKAAAAGDAEGGDR